MDKEIQGHLDDNYHEWNTRLKNVNTYRQQVVKMSVKFRHGEISLQEFTQSVDSLETAIAKMNEIYRGTKNEEIMSVDRYGS